MGSFGNVNCSYRCVKNFSNWKIHEADTVAFLPAAGIFRTLEGAYLAENKWSGREDLNLRPPGPEPDLRVYWNW
jgi:hypothetical protein